MIVANFNRNRKILNTNTFFLFENRKIILYKMNFNDILSDIDNGKNILLLGPGGCGKSKIIQVIYRIYKNKFDGDVYLTASTGVAAYNIGGITVHSWSGIMTGEEDVELYIQRCRVKDMLRKTRILIVDEISMIGKNLFDKLNEYFQTIRKNKQPFGGIQTIFSGDFMQLAPVKDDWIFKSKNWNDFAFSVYSLSKCWRFNDPDFEKMLMRIRTEDHTKNDIEQLKARIPLYQKIKKTYHKLEIKPTILYSKNVDVKDFNEKN